MIPDALRPEDFLQYSPQAGAFARRFLALLRKLPLAVCPSFLRQIQDVDSAFPVERRNLEQQCESLMRMPEGRFAELALPLKRITLTPELERLDWVNRPRDFINEMTSCLWSTGQIGQFRSASSDLLSSVPARIENLHRLTIVLFGKDAKAPLTPALDKLRRRGLTLTSLDARSMVDQLADALKTHAEDGKEEYAQWYVDGGGDLLPRIDRIPGMLAVSYDQLSSLRENALLTMRTTAQGGSAGAELMRTRLATTTPKELGASKLTADPVLQRFFAELFTQSSGPQLFSSSFVQWTGRELARRAQPRSLLLRYTARQSYKPFDEMLGLDHPREMDAEGAMRDAEMGAWYNMLEMNRISTNGKATFVAWREGTSFGIIAGPNAPAGTTSNSAMSLRQALDNFS